MRCIAKTILVVTAFLVVQGLTASPPAAAEAKKPNILVIWGDDIGIHNTSAYNLGIMGYHTPNIDRIGEGGNALHGCLCAAKLHGRSRTSLSVAPPVGHRTRVWRLWWDYNMTLFASPSESLILRCRHFPD